MTHSSLSCIQIMDWMDEIAADCPAGLECEVTVPGSSYEGRDMKVLHVSRLF